MMLQRERDAIRELLESWQAGEIDECVVHQEAERLWESREHWPAYPEHDPRSIVIELLAQLEILNHQLIIREDIPVMLAFLDTPRGRELEGWESWRRYWDELDYEARQEAVKGEPYYSA